MCRFGWSYYVDLALGEKNLFKVKVSCFIGTLNLVSPELCSIFCRDLKGTPLFWRGLHLNSCTDKGKGDTVLRVFRNV